MSTTVSYKGNTLTTVSNNTKTLKTQGKYLEADVILTDVSQAASVLETVTKSYTPTESQQTETITPSVGYDGIAEVDVTVGAVASGSVSAPASITATGASSMVDTTNRTVTLTKNNVTNTPTITEGYVSSATGTTSNVQLTGALAMSTVNAPTATKGSVSNHSVSVTPSVTFTNGWVLGNTQTGAAVTVSASELVSGTKSITSSGTTDVTNYANASVAAGSVSSPLATKGTVSNNSISVTPSVDYSGGYISSGARTGLPVTVSASELVSGTKTITTSGTTDVTNYASASVAAGSATASATKGSVSNHSITVTPSVTTTAGYVTAGSSNGTAVSVSASELVSGSQTLSTNATYNVTNLAEVVVNVSGGSSGYKVAVLDIDGMDGRYIYFDGGDIDLDAVSGRAMIMYRGTSSAPVSGTVESLILSPETQYGTIYTQNGDYSGYSMGGYYGSEITNNNQLCIWMESFTGFTFNTNGDYKLILIYGGDDDIEFRSASYSPPSGVTSGQFTVSDEPVLYYGVLESQVTPASYHRVSTVVKWSGESILCGSNFYTNTSGYITDLTETYNNGTLTVATSGTNNGGYFHNPGTYTLYYLTAEDLGLPNYQQKTVSATTSQQNITADSGFDALSKVIVTAVSQTNLSAENIKSGTTISISNGQSNLWSVTGSYTGGGGTLTVATKTLTNTAVSQTLSFTSLSGQPKYWFLRVTSQVSSSGSTTYYYITDLFYDGTNVKGNTFRIGSTRRIYNITSGITQSYSNGTLTITGGSAAGSTPGQFYGASGIGYELIYIY